MAEEQYWMGMSREEYLLLSYILYEIGPEGEAVVDPERAAETLGIDPGRVKELLESLQRKRLITITAAPEADKQRVLKLFDAFRDASTGPEGLSYFRREVRALYLNFTRSLRGVLEAGDPRERAASLDRALYYSLRLEPYRSLGEITLRRLETLMPAEDLEFSDVVNILYQISIYMYPVVTLLARKITAPWGEEINVYAPSQKALQARLRSLGSIIERLESVAPEISGPRQRRAILTILAGLKRERIVLEGLSRVLARVEEVLGL